MLDAFVDGAGKANVGSGTGCWEPSCGLIIGRHVQKVAPMPQELQENTAVY
jgi:hypothetical protein